jgi:folate-binding protein YgfZ
LSPQGKILFDMLVVRAPGDDGPSFLLDCPVAQVAELARRLGFYKLRAKVTVADVTRDLGVVASWGEEREFAAGAIVYDDPRASGLGWRAILPRARAEAVGAAHVGEYDALRIGLAVPKGGVDFAYGDAFPHDANLDSLQGVDFGKGCYVGQEVVSRMKHRGTARKRIARVKVAAEPPPPGTPVLDGGLMIGTLGSSAGREALAMLRLDRIEDAKVAGRGLSAGGVGVAVVD